MYGFTSTPRSIVNPSPSPVAKSVFVQLEQQAASNSRSERGHDWAGACRHDGRAGGDDDGASLAREERRQAGKDPGSSPVPL